MPHSPSHVCRRLADEFIPSSVLHPTHKLEHFKIMNWPAAWQQNAKELLFEEFQHLYLGRKGAEEADEEASDEDALEDDGDIVRAGSNSSKDQSSDEDLHLSEVRVFHLRRVNC